jgi:hypothetical protein
VNSPRRPTDERGAAGAPPHSRPRPASERGAGGTPLRAPCAAAAGGTHDVTVEVLYDLIAGSGSRALAVIGLVKNAGKTTVVNALLATAHQRFGLTSLGLDGERVDHLTGLAKPRIAPPPGTLVATTRGSLQRSHYALDVLEELPFHTPLGRVVIGRAGGDGRVEVSGPTTLAELRRTVERLLALGAEQVLVDGAINRVGSASPRVSDALLLATGGMAGDTLDDVLEATVAAVDMLTLPQTDAATAALLAPYAAQRHRAVSFDAAGRAETLDLQTVVGEGVTVARRAERLGTRTLYVGGALTQEFVDDFARVLPPQRTLRLVVRDSTVLVLPPAAVGRLLRRGVAVEVLAPLRLLAVTANPFRVPRPYRPGVFFAAVAEALGGRVPVFDVVNGLAAPAGEAPATRHLPQESR